MKTTWTSLREKLVGVVLFVSASVAAFVVLAIMIDLDTIESASRLEAQHVAMTIASPDIGDAIRKPKLLQARIDSQHSLYKRDAVIVDTSQVRVADVNRTDVGKKYGHPGDEVGKTLADGIPRAFVEKNARHPDGAMQTVVPLHATAGDPHSRIIGAIILEYTQIYQEQFAAKRAELYAMIVGGIACVTFVAFLGLRVVRSLSERITSLQRGVSAIAAGDYDARVIDSKNDELGILGDDFNRMAADLHSSRATLHKHGLELDQSVDQRTLELSAPNTPPAHEIGEEKRASEKTEFQVYYDSLTSLPNRGMFGKFLEQGLMQAKRYNKQLAVLFVDLDRLKQINDSLGHQAGDELLQEIARRLRSSLRESDIVARLGGDEFVVMLTELGNEKHARTVAEKIRAAISHPMNLRGQELRVTVSIGIATYPENGTDESALMRNADTAMCQAKAEGRNVVRFYSEQLNTNSLERVALESSLRHALEHNEFLLHYQPRMDLQRGGVTGVEALLRWQHPELGTVPPLKFIPIAEETGLIVSIGKWVLKTACAQSARWHQQGLPDLSIAVNLSPTQFADEMLVPDVKAILRETGMRSHLLELEITESMLIQNPKKTTEILTALKEIGIRLAIVDFGAGHSSLSNLKLVPIDTIKIDRSFVRNLQEDQEDQGITSAIIATGRALSLKVIAEGVETQEQADFLRAHLCDEIQGFYFSKAVPASELEAVLQNAPPLSSAVDTVEAMIG